MSNQEILERLDRIEETLKGKLEPLLDLLQTVINTNINKSGLSETSAFTQEPAKVEKPDLMYTTDEENVYISGNKTYDNRTLIKATFQGSSWNKERSAWAFKKFDNFEETLSNVFPNIVKG